MTIVSEQEASQLELIVMTKIVLRVQKCQL